MFFEYDFPTWRVVLQSCLVLLAGGIATFLMKLYRIRHKFQVMQKEGLVSVSGHPSHTLWLAAELHLIICTANASPPPCVWSSAIRRRNHVQSP